LNVVPTTFKVGDRVRVRAADPPGHVRTPYYCRGHVGTVERICGAFPNPEELAYGRPGLPAQPLYRVRFSSVHLWPGYAEDPADVVEIEIYQHWLESGEPSVAELDVDEANAGGPHER
jgi:nitrile hydratase